MFHEYILPRGIYVQCKLDAQRDVYDDDTFPCFTSTRDCSIAICILPGATALWWPVDWVAIKVHEKYIGFHINLPIREHLVEWLCSLVS